MQFIQKMAYCFSMLILTLCIAPYTFSTTRGLSVNVKTSQGEIIPLYQKSYALIVGNGNYTMGWDPLPGAINDVKEVGAALEKNGFSVILKTDLTKGAFSRTFAEFAYKYGKNRDNRLLFYFAGHGHTQKMATSEDMGYLVMVDAPLPEKDPIGFSLSSVDMQSLITQSKIIKARHVLFMFDSCFSGSIFNYRKATIPQYISESVKLPVRQFITAGMANEPVPDYSVFKQLFLDLLEGRVKEPIPDGYITGDELGMYLKTKVPQYNPRQHPQYGKLWDTKLDKGDFVFIVGSNIPGGQVFLKNSIGMEFVKIPPAELFLMGSSLTEEGREKDEQPHRVTITKVFYMQTTEVTQGQWKKVMGDYPSRFSRCGDDCPVENVSWFDVMKFIETLNQMENTNKYRLPTEAEWEFASRGGSNTRFFFGDDISKLREYAWYQVNSEYRTHPVGRKDPNLWGLYDMYGNVMEWCQDWYKNYSSTKTIDPLGPSSGSTKVCRGGSWLSKAESSRSANRVNLPPGDKFNVLGFRLVKTF